MTAVDELDDLADFDLAPVVPAPHAGRRRVARQRRRRTRQPVVVRARRGEPHVNFYPNVAAFVEDFLAPVFAHQTGRGVQGFCWCPRWWAHAEAIVRLEAAWRAWEVLRRDPGLGPSIWLRDHADPCMAALTGEDGPFRKCTTGHTSPPALPCEPSPPGLF